MRDVPDAALETKRENPEPVRAKVVSYDRSSILEVPPENRLNTLYFSSSNSSQKLHDEKSLIRIVFFKYIHILFEVIFKKGSNSVAEGLRSMDNYRLLDSVLYKKLFN